MSAIKLDKVSNNIRAIREFRNYSQDYLAQKLGMSQNGYSKIELGYTNITLQRVCHIADILEVNLNDIIELDLEKLQKILPQKMTQK